MKGDFKKLLKNTTYFTLKNYESWHEINDAQIINLFQENMAD